MLEKEKKITIQERINKLESKVKSKEKAIKNLNQEIFGLKIEISKLKQFQNKWIRQDNFTGEN